MLGNDAKRAYGGQHLRFGAVDVVNTVAFPDTFPFTPTRKVEVTREDIARVTLPVRRVATATAAPVEI